ncbi:hypothetical protein [Aestuariibacter sp. A3R04]|uniref:hypothetical protein n=1 Tax=Aestuariibacter sp. A3R04 TaxID=2841571 RepID=UPI001C0854ED|nr:hypothetical protein [Aestuariibacter sp. A3R04]MBU3023457.1 hypothetical protein [Aestuariibacter sp. A3R04]
MLDLTNSISNAQQYPNVGAQNLSTKDNTAEVFSQTLEAQSDAGETQQQAATNSSDLQSSFNNLLSGNASDEDITTMQNALFNSLKQALFTDNANSSDVLSQQKTSLKGETTTTTETVTDGDTSNTSETSETFWELVDSVNTLSFGEDGLGLDDAFDAVNILNHIPIISDIYTDISSQDSVDAAAAIAGGYMFTGPVGALYSAANVVTEEMTGSSILDNLISIGRSFIGEESSAADTVENVATRVAASVTDAAANNSASGYQFVSRDAGSQGV